MVDMTTATALDPTGSADNDPDRLLNVHIYSARSETNCGPRPHCAAALPLRFSRPRTKIEPIGPDS